MNTAKRKWTWMKILAAGVLALGMGVVERAEAGGGTTDVMLVSVTPGNVTYGVTITSVNANGYEFGTVNINASTVSTAAIVLTNSGNISEYFSMAISNSSPDSWAPHATDVGNNQFVLYAYLNSSQPSGAAFSDALTGSAPSTAATKYNQGSTKTTGNSTKNLWLKLSMPSSVSSSSAQTMTLSVTGQVN